MEIPYSTKGKNHTKSFAQKKASIPRNEPYFKQHSTPVISLPTIAPGCSPSQVRVTLEGPPVTFWAPSPSPQATSPSTKVFIHLGLRPARLLSAGGAAGTRRDCFGAQQNSRARRQLIFCRTEDQAGQVAGKETTGRRSSSDRVSQISYQSQRLQTQRGLDAWASWAALRHMQGNVPCIPCCNFIRYYIPYCVSELLLLWLQLISFCSFDGWIDSAVKQR